MQVVFWDMRGPFLEALYKHHVRQARLALVLEGLDTALSQLCAASVPDVHPLLAQGLLHASTNGLLRVLLHGGPDRSAPAAFALGTGSHFGACARNGSTCSSCHSLISGEAAGRQLYMRPSNIHYHSSTKT